MSGNGTRTADFVILGAGVMGASIAFHLAQGKLSAAPRTNLQEVLERASGGYQAGKKPRCCAGSRASTI